MKVRVWAVFYADRGKFVLQWKDPVTGKRRTQRCDATGRRAADRAAKDLEAEINSGLPQADGRSDWRAFVVDYLDHHAAGLKARSEQKLATTLEVFSREMSPRTVGSVTTAFLTAYVAASRKAGRAEATIHGHLVIIRGAMRYAQRQGLIRDVPEIPEASRSLSGRRAKGRPLSLPEFVRLLRTIPATVGEPHAVGWRHLVIGLWLSGLRLDEALNLTWDDHRRLHVILTGKRPLLGLTAEYQKSFRDQLAPLTPDFCRFLLRTPAEDRHGCVFRVSGERSSDVRGLNYVSKVIGRFGEAAGVVVEPRSGKFASAHDLRRTFAERWAHRVQPATLRELMRHSSVQTSEVYYASVNAQKTAEILWSTTNRTTDSQKIL